MANQVAPSGLSHQVKKKLDAKRDHEKEGEILDWISAITGQQLDRNKSFEDLLHNGVLLCNLINKLQPGSVKKINQDPKMPFKIMENINAFQEGIKKYGVPNSDVFQTVDLFEKKDVGQVAQCLLALGRTCQTHSDYNGPILGPKMAEEHKRNFTDEDIKAGRNTISLQMGTNQGASQAGMSMGKPRHIVD